MHECNQAISGWKEYHMSENTISLYVYKGGQGEITEKKSRFIATVRPVESEDEAVSFINETKKKYWDARHNCSAFLCPLLATAGAAYRRDPGSGSGCRPAPSAGGVGARSLLQRAGLHPRQSGTGSPRLVHYPGLPLSGGA